MDKQPYRFSQHFGYDPAQMIDDLGMDVQPRDHQMETGLYVGWILEAEERTFGALPMTSDEAGIVLFAALIHDMGETTHPDILAEVGAVVGDIPYGEKTDADRHVEANVRAALYHRLYPDVSPDVLERVEAIIAHKDDTILHDIFEAAHSLQAFRTAVRAGDRFAQEWWRLIDDPDTMTRDDATIALLGGLFETVATNMLPQGVYWGERFQFAQEFLSEYQDILATFQKHGPAVEQ